MGYHRSRISHVYHRPLSFLGRFAAMMPTMANTKVKIITTKGRTSQLQESQEKFAIFFFGLVLFPADRTRKMITNPKLQANQSNFSNMNLDSCKIQKKCLSDFGGSGVSCCKESKMSNCQTPLIHVNGPCWGRTMEHFCWGPSFRTLSNILLSDFKPNTAETQPNQDQEV